MRTKFVAAMLLAAGVTLLSSCDWFKSGNKQSPFNIQGKWTVDSINPGKDSTAVLPLLAIVALKDDSLGFDFKEDSTYVQLPETSNEKGRYYIKDKELFIAEDTSFVPYKLHVVSDSLINLISNDSLFIAMKRQ